MKFELLKDKLGDWYDPLRLRITDEIYDKIYTAALSYQKNTCYPEPKDIFRAFKVTKFSDVKVVILGQDPYHDGNATGLAFECKNYVSPSMDSIHEAYQAYDPSHFNVNLLSGKLSPWAEQGVLLLNTALTVERGKPNSHKEYWDEFTIEVIKAINRKLDPVVFILWGKEAYSYLEYIVSPPHYALASEHPVAAKYQNRPWKHNDCFEVCNQILVEKYKTDIKW